MFVKFGGRVLEVRGRISVLKGQFMRYVFIGTVNTALDFGLYTLLTRSSDFWRERYLWANALTFVIVVTWSFFWNKYWTFRNHETRHAQQYVKFVFATICSIGIAEGVLYIGVQIFHLHDLLSKVIAAPLTVTWNFLTYRLWAFRSRRPPAPPLAEEEPSPVTSTYEAP